MTPILEPTGRRDHSIKNSLQVDVKTNPAFNFSRSSPVTFSTQSYLQGLTEYILAFRLEGWYGTSVLLTAVHCHYLRRHLGKEASRRIIHESITAQSDVITG